MRPYVDGLRKRGIDAIAIDLPRGRAERAAPAFTPYTGEFVGGHSFGGRAASLAAAEGDFVALVCFSFPLAGRAAERTAHFERIRCPVLIVNGRDDQLAPAHEMLAAAGRLPFGQLVLIEGAGHGLGGHLEEALDLAAGFLLTLAG
jgi:predicted alpha/beta-hydrolase family hydrolase